MRDPQWQLLTLTSEPAALLSIWGSSAEDVWVVGGRPGLAAGPTVLHYSNGAWTRPDVQQPGLDLWWVFGLVNGDMFFGGSQGTILRYHGGAFEKMVTPSSTGTVFGIWGANDHDLWAVGENGSAAIVWRYDGTSWSDAAIPGLPHRMFKVNGQSPADVWLSGDNGVALTWQGSTLEQQQTGVTAPLFSIVTTADSAIAVGGVSGEGQIVEHTASGWAVDTTLSAPATWRGAAARGAMVYAVGESGIVAQRGTSGWTTLLHPGLLFGNFHAAWVDPDGGLWGAGGNFDQLPLTGNGFLTYYGAATIGGTP